MKLDIFATLCLLMLASLAKSQQLPSTIVPNHYDLLIDTDIDSWTYDGAVNISVSITATVSDISLYYAESVSIETMELCSDPCLEPRSMALISSQTRDLDDLVVFTLVEPLQSGEYIIRSKFSGNVSSNMVGYFQTGYQVEHPFLGTTTFVKMTATHLSPDKARTVFPCFDEPHFRAKFTLTLIHPADQTVTSNMPIDHDEFLGGDRKLTRFQTSPKMSTYLLAWVQHNFVYGPRSVLTPAGVVKLKHFIPRESDRELTTRVMDKLDLLAGCLKFFNEFFDIAYPLPKLDLIGIPNYMFGGMEHWGIITVSLETATSKKEMRFGDLEFSFRNLIAHEISHMWFGNLVTMEWWDDIWLKEGMASLLSLSCVDSIFDDVDTRDWHMLKNWHPAMLADQEANSHPVRIAVESDVTTTFNTIAYRKGASVLAMVRFMLGEKLFSTGINNFLKRYQYSTATYNDLVTSITENSHDRKPIRDSMDSFIFQKNYPLISVERISPNEIKLTQSRCVKRSNSTNLHWTVPIEIYGLRDGKFANILTTPYVMMTGKTMNIKLEYGDFEMIKLNSDGKAMYVTHYPEENLIKLLELAKLPNSQLNHRERAHLICDIFHAAGINLLPYSSALEYVSFLATETHFLPLRVALDFFRDLTTKIDESLGDCLRGYISEILQLQLKILDRGGLSPIEMEMIIETLNQYGALVAKHEGDKKTGLNNTQLSHLRKYRLMSEDERSSNGILFETSKAEEVDMIGRELIQFPSAEPSKDIMQFLTTYSTSNPESVWNFFRENFDYVHENCGHIQFAYPGALKAMISNQRDEQNVAEIEKFFAVHPGGAGSLAIGEGLEEAHDRIDFRAESTSMLQDYLVGKGYCDTTLLSKNREIVGENLGFT